MARDSQGFTPGESIVASSIRVALKAIGYRVTSDKEPGVLKVTHRNGLTVYVSLVEKGTAP